MNNPLYNRVLDRVVTAQSEKENVTCLEQINSIKDLLNYYITVIENSKDLINFVGEKLNVVKLGQTETVIHCNKLKIGALNVISREENAQFYIGYNHGTTPFSNPQINGVVGNNIGTVFATINPLYSSRTVEDGYILVVYNGANITRVICDHKTGTYISTKTTTVWEA